MLTPEQEALRAELGLPEDAGPAEIRLALELLEATWGPLDRAAFDVRLGSRLEVVKSERALGGASSKRISVVASVATSVLIGLFGLAVVFFAARSSWSPWLRIPALVVGLAIIADSIRDIYTGKSARRLSP
jgi:hypothetical protein